MRRRLAAAFAAFALTTGAAQAQSPSDSGEIDRSTAMMRPIIERYQADRTTLERSWVEGAHAGRKRFEGGVQPIHAVAVRRWAWVRRSSGAEGRG